MLFDQLKSRFWVIALATIFIASGTCLAAEKSKIVLHVSDNNPRTLNATIMGAKALQKHYGAGNVEIEIVANSLGISLVNSKNKYNGSIKGLLNQGVSVTACNATLNMMIKLKNREIPIVEGVKLVPFGLVHVHELQKKGYIYISP